MDSLAALARERVVMTTIADRIVAVAAGRSLRVVVGATCPDEFGFADHLTRALHARGRPCLCVRSSPGAAPPDGHRPPGPRTAPIVAVITSMTAGSDQTPPCQVDIRLDRATTHTEPPDEAVDSDPAAHGLGVAGDALADIIVDTGPAGPVIRHIQPATTPPRVS